MGTRFEFTAVANEAIDADLAIEAGIAEVQRIEKLISSWNEKSQTSKINRMAGIKPVKVDKELFDLVARSLRVSNLTSGAFDISFASAGKLWKFDGTMKSLPSDEEIKKSVAKINYKDIILNDLDTTVFLKEKGMRIGFGGIGKGYAAEQAKRIMMDKGIKNGVVNASGDLTTWGKQANGKEWEVGIARPDQTHTILGWLQASETSVVTSGNYEKYFMYQGKRYAHIIDPKTGYPTTGVKSATIVCPNAELADALATSMFVLGEKEGTELINHLNGIESLIITDDDRLVASKNLNIKFKQNESNE